jgi:hypothetical protein
LQWIRLDNETVWKCCLLLWWKQSIKPSDVKKEDFDKLKVNGLTK